jgi:protein-S-isoprenylcysteine O-methyltransferase Ste14
MPLIFIVIWVVWFLSEVYLNIFMRSAKGQKENHDQNSMSWIWLIILGSVGLAVLSVNWIQLPVMHSPLINNAGLVIILSGMVLRFIAIRSLGKFFTVNLTLHSNHHLITTGPFRYLRHPSYTGLLLSFFGLGLSLNNWISLFSLVIPIFVIILKRVDLEEKMLISQFGQEYLDYRKKTWKLIPGIL